MKYAFAMIACVFAFTSAAFCSDACVQTNHGKCFSIHARYAVYTADGKEVLWLVGTHRLLGVVSGPEQLYLLQVDHPSNFFVFGDFDVCPLTREIPGEMRHVCIKEMKNLRRVKRKP